jgi:hypothetical protein
MALRLGLAGTALGLRLLLGPLRLDALGLKGAGLWPGRLGALELMGAGLWPG